MDVTGNTIDAAHRHPIYVQPDLALYYNHSIDTTNTQKGRPIYYYFGEDSITVENLDDIGGLSVASSNNIKIRNINISKSGILISWLENSTLTNCNIFKVR